MSTPVPPDRKHARQLRTVTILAVLLILIGVLVLTVLHRVPLPMRIAAGLGDIFVGAVLLVLVRQHATPK